MVRDNLNADIFLWLDQSICRKTFKNNYKVDVTGTSEKCDGYIGDIIFASVRGKTEENTEKELHLAIKHGKNNEHLRKIAPVRAAFEREIFIYEKVMPLINKFQLDKNINDRFDSYPKCYNTLIFSEMEVLVMENLKKQGYELYERTKPLDINHMKAVLKEYGKWHALSFALRDQKYEDYKSLTAGTPNILLEFLNKWDPIMDPVTSGYNQLLDIFKEKGENKLYEELQKLVDKEGPKNLLINLIRETCAESESVITHGDCWNNNFMYKYEGIDKTFPSKVVILDWQLSHIRSPVFDLAYFIYGTGSKNQLDHFDELLDIYYISFSNFLTQLGSDPKIIFPLSTLKRHWKKYSLFGFLIMLYILPIVLCSGDKPPTLDDIINTQDFGYFANMDLKQKNMYFERTKSMLNHYFSIK